MTDQIKAPDAPSHLMQGTRRSMLLPSEARGKEQDRVSAATPSEGKEIAVERDLDRANGLLMAVLVIVLSLPRGMGFCQNDGRPWESARCGLPRYIFACRCYLGLSMRV